ncbi:MAG: sugar phosphate isomerase/epimerase family protein [Rectinemataceae bacterium]
MIKYAVISSFLSRTKDRFHEYNQVLSLEQKFQAAAEIPGMAGLECVYPYEVNAADEVKALMKKYKLGISAVNVNVKAEPEFRNGGLTSPDKAVRAKAVRFIKEAKDFAAAIGADKVTCCPLGDGYEFGFQVDYSTNWGYLKETFGEAAAYRPDITLFIEYKPSETRGTCFLNNAAKTVLLIQQLRLPGLGVTLDFGHSMYGGSNPAEELALLHDSGLPYYVHINDNDAKWDWDYFAGSKHFLAYAEFLYYLRKYGYDDYVTSDTSPTRYDIKGMFEANNRITAKLLSRLEAMEKKGLGDLIGSGDYMKTWKFLEEELFGLK